MFESELTGYSFALLRKGLNVPSQRPKMFLCRLPSLGWLFNQIPKGKNGEIIIYGRCNYPCRYVSITEIGHAYISREDAVSGVIMVGRVTLLTPPHIAVHDVHERRIIRVYRRRIHVNITHDDKWRIEVTWKLKKFLI